MIKQVHSYWAYIVLAILIFAIFNAIKGLINNKEFTDKDLQISLFALIVSHIQLFIGFAWYFMSPWYKNLKAEGVNESNRELAVEHPIVMILAIILITIGFSRHKKKTTSKTKFNTIFIFYTIALLLVLYKIPWEQWF